MDGPVFVSDGGDMESVAGGVPIVVVVMGLVEFAKRMGVKGRASLALSMALGTGFGIAYQVSLAIPSDFAGWMGAGVFGLALGLTASGLYDVATKRKAA